MKFVQLITNNLRYSPLVLIAGDFNCLQDSLEYQVLCKLGKLVDSYRVVHPTDFGATMVKDVLVDSNPKRLDYVFFKRNKLWNLIDCQIYMKHDDGFFYSDHLGVGCIFEFLEETEENDSLVQTNAEEKIKKETSKKLISEISSEIQNGIQGANSRRTSHLIRILILVFTFYFLGFVLNSFPFLSIWYIILGFYIATEIFLAIFVINDEISSLQQIKKEIMIN